MAVVDRAEREVVVLVGVPLIRSKERGQFHVEVQVMRRHCTTGLVGARGTHGISEGVSGLELGGGRLIKVGGCVCAMVSVD
jgi:hypothetical protein